MELDLAGKKALVTGASMGIGAAIALELAAEGASVIINSRSAERLEETAEAIHSATGNKPKMIVADISNTNELAKLSESIEKEKLDIYVSNGGGPRSGLLTELPLESWQEASDLLLRPVVTLTHSILNGMIERKFGRLIYITSIAALQPIDTLMLSNTFRAGISGFSKTVSNNYAKYGITSNCVCPGYTATERLEELAEQLAERGKTTVDKVMGSFAEDNSVRRIGEPEEIASAVTFLASEKAGYITGSSLAVDGGSRKATF